MKVKETIIYDYQRKKIMEAIKSIQHLIIIA